MKKSDFEIVPPSDVLSQLAKLHSPWSASSLSSAVSLLDQEKLRIEAAFGPIAKHLENADRLTEAFTLSRAIGDQIADIDALSKSLFVTGASARASALAQACEIKFTAASHLATFYKMDNLLETFSAKSNLYDLTLIQPSLQFVSKDLLAAFEPAGIAYKAWRDSAVEVFDTEIFTPINIPAREQFLSTDILESLQEDHIYPEEITYEREIIIEEVEEHLFITLEDALNQINPNLYKLWTGAWQSLVSSNPDKIRHTLTSARELVRIVIHELSPDDQVKNWSNEKIHFHEGRPTHRARLLFIVSHVQNSALQELLIKEVEACVCLTKIFNTGTHSLEPPFNETQLKVILRKVHSMICALVEMRGFKNR